MLRAPLLSNAGPHWVPGGVAWHVSVRAYGPMRDPSPADTAMGVCPGGMQSRRSWEFGVLGRKKARAAKKTEASSTVMKMYGRV